MVVLHGIATMQGPKILRHAIDSLAGLTGHLALWETDPVLKFCLHTVLPLLRRPVSIEQLDMTAYVLSLLLVGALAALALLGGRYGIISASRKAERDLRHRFFTHTQTLTPTFFHTTRTGDLMTRSGSDMEQVRMLLGPGIMHPAQTLWIIILVLTYMFSRDAVLALAILLPMVVLGGFVNFWTRIVHRLSLRAQETYSNLSSHVQENLSGIRVVKAYLQEEAESARFRDINQQYMEHNLGMVRVRAKAWPLMRFLGSMGMIILFLAGGYRTMSGAMTVGELWQYVSYFLMLFWPMVAFGWILNVLFRGTVSWHRIDTLLQTQPLVRDDPDVRDVVLGPPAIELRSLTFTYPGHPAPVLEDVNLQVQAGSTVAIVGPTGCGKSTLVNLLLHHYPVRPDQIHVAGQDLTQVPLRQLRESIASVSQEVFLFSTSIRENMLLGVDENGYDAGDLDAAMRWAGQLARLEEEVAGFADGYDTQLGERGITLSGGQRQRLGIARALILRRPILLLDDCLSAVDTHTEELILQGLQGEMEDRTTILISHRVSTVKRADTIVVLDDGRIVERGAHDDLIERDGLYASMHRRQLLEESLGIRT